jgi:hypothetical protein
MKPAAAATAVALLLAGCANVPTVAYVDNTGQMDRAEFMTWLNDHTTLVSVTGSPFAGMSNDALARVVAAEMPTGFTHGGRYTADVQQASGTQYRLVWNFGVIGMDSYGRSCALPSAAENTAASSAVAAPTKVSAVLSFCRSDGPLLRAYGYVGDVPNPDAPNFRQWVTQMTLNVLVFDPSGGKGGGGGGGGGGN